MDADRFGQDASEIAYRAHVREVNTARQEAEARHRRAALARRGQGSEGRDADDQALREELAGIAKAHRAWLRDHGVGGRA